MKTRVVGTLIMTGIIALGSSIISFASEDYTEMEKYYVSKSWRAGYGYEGYNDGYTYKSRSKKENEWVLDSGDWFYTSNGGTAVSGSLELDDTTYYFDTHGIWIEPESARYNEYMNYINEIYNAFENIDTNYSFYKDGWNKDDYFNILGIINNIKFDSIIDNTFQVGITYENDGIVIKDNEYTRKNREYLAKSREFISKVIAEVNKLHTDEEKAAYINDIIVDTFDYDYSYRDTGSGYIEAFSLNKKIVCSGYATIFSDLCKRVGLESDVINGETAAGVPHAWNYVRIDNRTKYIDVCWNDTSGNNRYVFLLPLRQISSDHIAY